MGGGAVRGVTLTNILRGCLKGRIPALGLGLKGRILTEEISAWKRRLWIRVESLKESKRKRVLRGRISVLQTRIQTQRKKAGLPSRLLRSLKRGKQRQTGRPPAPAR